MLLKATAFTTITRLRLTLVSTSASEPSPNLTPSWFDFSGGCQDSAFIYIFPSWEMGVVYSKETESWCCLCRHCHLMRLVYLGTQQVSFGLLHSYAQIEAVIGENEEWWELKRMHWSCGALPINRERFRLQFSPLLQFELRLSTRGLRCSLNGSQPQPQPHPLVP